MNPHGCMQQVKNVCPKSKLADCNQRLNSWLVSVWISGAKDFQPSSRDLESMGYGHMKPGQFHAAVKAGGKSLDYPRMQDRFSVIDHEGDDNYGSYRHH